ncbi:MAG: recombinase family protein [Methylocystaceae bacterium]|nr:recombinase family protein [Methylocystaceae bacterium]
MKQYIAYYRVSTSRQGTSGLGLEAQRRMIENYLNGAEAIAHYTEVESGRKTNRSELNKALAHCKQTGATLIIGKLDRLARNAAFLLSLRDSGIEFVACDMPSANRLVVGIMALVAEEEANTIADRTKKALAQSSKKLGFANPVRTDQETCRQKGHATQRFQADNHAQNILPIISEIKAFGITTLSGIAAAMNSRGIKTQRGGRWHPTTVKNILTRIELC